MNSQDLFDYVNSHQPVDGVYAPAAKLIRDQGVFRVDDMEFRTIAELKAYLAKLFPVEGLLFEGDELVASVDRFEVIDPPTRTETHGGVGGPPFRAPTRRGLRTLKFSVIAQLDINKRYNLVDHDGASYHFAGGDFYSADATTHVTTQIP